MLKSTGWGLAVLSAALLGMAAPARAADKTLARESFTFGTLTPPSEAQVRLQAARWLKEQDKMDRQAFDAIWSSKDKPVLDRLAAALSMGDKGGAAPLEEAHEPTKFRPHPPPAGHGANKRA